MGLYGAVVPPMPPGWSWTPEPGMWTADVYEYQGKVLRVTARISPGAAAQRGLTLCLWTGGGGQSNKILGCAPVVRP